MGLNDNFEPHDSKDLLDFSLRPVNLREYAGQRAIKEMLEIYITTALKRKESLDHVLLYGPPGLGKTTLAHIIANEMNTKIKVTTGPALKRPGDLAAILTSLEPGNVLFIDEIHRLSKKIEEMLYSAMEDFAVDIIIGKDQEANTLRIDLPPFTLVAATTRIGSLSSPLRDRFGIIEKLNYYTLDELVKIITRTSKILNYDITNDASLELARRSRGTPRIANKLFRRIRDFAEYHNEKIITKDICLNALEKLHIDKIGLDLTDIKYLTCLIEKFNGGPAGINSLAASLNEESITIEEVNEPFLLEEGFIILTKRGRMATPKAFKHIKNR